jgi:hypothetical protein
MEGPFAEGFFIQTRHFSVVDKHLESPWALEKFVAVRRGSLSQSEVN